MDRLGRIGRYDGPDELAHVYAFCCEREHAESLARDLNDCAVTRKGKFHIGTFRVSFIEGRTWAVIGTLTGN